MRIGVTGHMSLTAATEPLVRDAIRRYLEGLSEPVVGVSCIARGADSLFAAAVLDTGGTLEVVLPSRDYREIKVKPNHVPLFDELLSKAAVVRTMPFDHANREAYEVANNAVIGSIDALIAVWDGNQPEGIAGTADVVQEARARGLPVEVIWPEGATRR